MPEMPNDQAVFDRDIDCRLYRRDIGTTWVTERGNVVGSLRWRSYSTDVVWLPPAKSE